MFLDIVGPVNITFCCSTDWVQKQACLFHIIKGTTSPAEVISYPCNMFLLLLLGNVQLLSIKLAEISITTGHLVAL